jgi:hypothetical protein
MFVIRKKLSPDEGAPPDTRYNPDTDTVETTPDGGTTWNENEGADPRRNPAYQLAPAGAQCAAAAGMVEAMKGFKEGVFGGLTLVGIATSALSGMIFLIPGIGWMWSLALGIAGGALTAGPATLYAAFTESVWEDILCILACHLDENGQMDQAAADAIQTEITTVLGGTVGLGVSLMFLAWGFVGFNNAGVLHNDPAADCAGCGCTWCFEVFLADGDFAFGTYSDVWGPHAIYVPGTGWTAHVNADREPGEHDRATFFTITRLLPDANYKHIEIDMNLDYGVVTAGTLSNCVINFGGTNLFTFTTDTSGTQTWDGDKDSSNEQLSFFAAAADILSYNNTGSPATGGFQFTRLLMSGDGFNPFGTNNC